MPLTLPTLHLKNKHKICHKAEPACGASMHPVQIKTQKFPCVYHSNQFCLVCLNELSSINCVQLHNMFSACFQKMISNAINYFNILMHECLMHVLNGVLCLFFFFFKKLKLNITLCIYI